MITLIGSIAAILTTLCFVPQVWQILKTKDTQAISLWMYITLTVGVVCWFVYGFLIESVPIMIANIVTFVLSIIIVWMKARAVLQKK